MFEFPLRDRFFDWSMTDEQGWLLLIVIWMLVFGTICLAVLHPGCQKGGAQ